MPESRKTRSLGKRRYQNSDRQKERQGEVAERLWRLHCVILPPTFTLGSMSTCLNLSALGSFHNAWRGFFIFFYQFHKNRTKKKTLNTGRTLNVSPYPDIYLLLKSFQTGLQLLNSAHQVIETTGRDKENRWSMRHQEMMTPDVLWQTTGIWIRLWLAMSSSFLFVPVDWRKDKYTHTYTHTQTTWIDPLRRIWCTHDLRKHPRDTHPSSRLRNSLQIWKRKKQTKKKAKKFLLMFSFSTELWIKLNLLVLIDSLSKCDFFKQIRSQFFKLYKY